MKKIFAIIMSVLMIACFMPSMAFAESNVAQIGETPYATLQTAIEAASARDEIVLLSNVTLTEKLTISKNITLNIGECKLSSTVTGTGAAIEIASGATVTIKGSGKIEGANGREASSPTQTAHLIQVSNGANLTLDGVTVAPGVTTTKSMTAPATTGVYVVNGTLNLKNATVNGGASSGKGNGGYGICVFQSGASLTAENSTIIGGALNSSGETNCEAGAAVYLQGGENPVNLTECTKDGKKLSYGIGGTCDNALYNRFSWVVILVD